MFAITCGKCEEASDAALWIETPLGQKRPKEHYQCPACRVAFIRKYAPPTVELWGEEEVLIPGDITLEFIPPVDKYESNTLPKRRK